MDWGLGRYEKLAERLVPAARTLVDAAQVQPGERVLDVGTGTGTAALLAARAGAHVTGVDPAVRLLGVARSRAATEGLDVELLEGEAAALPVADQSVDIVLSSFAVIFAVDPKAVAAELVRVLVPGGRILFSAWLPGSAMSRYTNTAQALVGEALGLPPPPPAFPWHELEPLTGLFGTHGLTPTLTTHEIAFTGSSPTAYLEADRQDHPLAVAGFEVLERMGRADAAHEALARILVEENEDPNAFRMTQRYVVVTARSAAAATAH